MVALHILHRLRSISSYPHQLLYGHGVLHRPLRSPIKHPRAMREHCNFPTASTPADFVLTQPIYEPKLAMKFLQRYGEQHGSLNVPVLVGVLPLFSPRHAAFLHNEVPGIHVPTEIHARMESAVEKAPQVGVQIALVLIDQMISFASGIYLMPQFGRYDLATEVVENCR